MSPIHEHDCDHCTFLYSAPLRHVRERQEWEEPGEPITHGDIYLSCDPGAYSSRYVVRYGTMGEYATTNVVTHYILAPLEDHESPDERQRRAFYERLGWDA